MHAFYAPPMSLALVVSVPSVVLHPRLITTVFLLRAWLTAGRAMLQQVTVGVLLRATHVQSVTKKTVSRVGHARTALRMALGQTRAWLVMKFLTPTLVRLLS